MDNIRLDFQKHIDAGRCNGAEWIINYKNNIYSALNKTNNISLFNMKLSPSLDFNPVFMYLWTP